MKQKGNILIYLLIGILFIGGVGGAYYLGTKKATPIEQTISQTPQPTLAPTSTPATSISDETANWKTLPSDVFTIKFPPAWIGKGDTGTVSIYDPTSMKSRGNNGGGVVNLPTKFVNLSIVNSDQTVKQFVDQTLAGPPYKSLDIKSQTIIFNNLSAEKYPEQGEGSSGDDIVVSDGKKHLVIINVPSSNSGVDLGVINQILSTFKFTN